MFFYHGLCTTSNPTSNPSVRQHVVCSSRPELASTWNFVSTTLCTLLFDAAVVHTHGSQRAKSSTTAASAACVLPPYNNFGRVECRSFEGWVLVEPLVRKFTYTNPVSGFTIQVERTQLPLMPASSCPLYSLQGASCDPGLIAHFVMPRRADDDIKWLIVYVMLSRVRSLSRLRSRGLNPKIRAIIEGGPPTMVAENFEKLFRQKILNTDKAAKAAIKALGWQTADGRLA